MLCRILSRDSLFFCLGLGYVDFCVLALGLSEICPYALRVHYFDIASLDKVMRQRCLQILSEFTPQPLGHASLGCCEAS